MTRAAVLGAGALLCAVAIAAAAGGTAMKDRRPAVGRAACAIADLMPVYWDSIEVTDGPARLRRTVLEAHPDLYNVDFVDLPVGAAWEARVARERAYASAHRGEIDAAERLLATHAVRFMQEFRATFPDFRCDFTFYVAPTFGAMDGAAAIVNGRQRIVFAPDVIPKYHTTAQIKVLVDHETFHIYHHQATGRFGASAVAVPAVIEALWGEGLATFVSWRMNPDQSLDAALLQPGIPEAAQPHLAAIAQDVLEHLDERDGTVYRHYFVANDQPEGYPPRAGYYLGLLIAQELAQRYTLEELGSLNGAALQAELTAALERFAAAGRGPLGQRRYDGRDGRDGRDG